jgi:hypothetical protein
MNYTKIWRGRNPEKYNAHKLVQKALRDGILIKENCLVCNNDKTQAHHKEYSKPLEVIWLCSKCHMKEHVKERQHLPKGKKISAQIIPKERHINKELQLQIINLKNDGKTYREIGTLVNKSASQCYKLAVETKYN